MTNDSLPNSWQMKFYSKLYEEEQKLPLAGSIAWATKDKTFFHHDLDQLFNTISNL